MSPPDVAERVRLVLGFRGLTGPQKAILMIMAARSNPQGICAASAPDISDDSGYATRTVRKEIQALHRMRVLYKAEHDGHWKIRLIAHGGKPYVKGRR